ncbi:SDR family oxidoreductase [Actinophytocola sp.]|uniref:SDR family oxidoreductase n=1 Tax=Actinophytocola sp. TaxID=1872138 RepID=UPI003D6B6D03
MNGERGGDLGGDLGDSRVLVVGGSSGIGRATGIAAAKAGARVAFAGRRTELLEEAAAEAGPDALALTCDVREADQCAEVVARTVDRFGGLDHLVLAVGMTYLCDVVDTTAAQWHDLAATNLIGPALVTTAAIPHLTDVRGKVVFISSAAVIGPWPGLVAYAAVKSGLETLARGLQDEHPTVGFSTVAISSTTTDVLQGIDRATLKARFSQWRERGFVSRGEMSPHALAEHLVGLLASPLRLPFVLAVPPPRPSAGPEAPRSGTG